MLGPRPPCLLPPAGECVVHSGRRSRCRSTGSAADRRARRRRARHVDVGVVVAVRLDRAFPVIEADAHAEPAFLAPIVLPPAPQNTSVTVGESARSSNARRSPFSSAEMSGIASPQMPPFITSGPRPLSDQEMTTSRRARPNPISLTRRFSRSVSVRGLSGVRGGGSWTQSSAWGRTRPDRVRGHRPAGNRRSLSSFGRHGSKTAVRTWSAGWPFS
jgi:hypothetical protein